MIQALRRVFRNLHVIFFDLYDAMEVDHQVAMGLLARVHDNRTARENPVELGHLMHLPRVREWTDEIVIQHDLAELQWTVKLSGYTVAAYMQEVNANRPNVAAKMKDAIKGMPKALARHQRRACLEVIRRNPICVTGKTFFADDHPRLDGSTFSNMLAPEVGDAGELTILEAAAMMEDAMVRFGAIATMDAEVMDDDKLQGNLLVIVHSAHNAKIFRKLRRAQNLPADLGIEEGSKENPHRGAFKLWFDQKETQGHSPDYVEFVLITGDDGPKVSIFVIDTDPEPFVSTDNVPSPGLVAYGYKQIWGVIPYLPNVAIQARPTAAPQALMGGGPASRGRSLAAAKVTATEPDETPREGLALADMNRPQLEQAYRQMTGKAPHGNKTDDGLRRALQDLARDEGDHDEDSESGEE